MPMRIAVVTDAVAPWNTGGKEQRQHELWTRLAARGHRIDVYTMGWWGPEPSVARDGVTFHAICRKRPLYSGARRSIRQALIFAVATLRVTRARFDVLEVDAIPFLPLFPARIVAWIRRRPMVVTWHEYWGQQYWRGYLGPAGMLAAAVEKLAISLPDRIVAASDETAGRLRQTVPGADVHVVTNGIRVDRTTARRSQPLVGRPLRLISAGRLLDHKRIDAAIATVADLDRHGIDSHLTVIGSGPAAASLRTCAHDLGVADRVEFLDFLSSHDEVVERMAESDLLLFPSEREGFGMVALEAMAVGTPVVTSDHPDNAARHLVTAGVDGEVCPSTGTAMGEAVRRMLPKLATLSTSAADRARDYDWERLAGAAEAAYPLPAERRAQGVVRRLPDAVDVDQAEVFREAAAS